MLTPLILKQREAQISKLPPYRYGDRTISSDFKPTASGLVSKISLACSLWGFQRCFCWSFLLIVRTLWIVTVICKDNEYQGIQRSFQHIAKFINVTTTVSIVTAAVYRGFDQELHLDESRLTPSINLPAPGRRHTLYVHLRVCRVLCF